VFYMDNALSCDLNFGFELQVSHIASLSVGRASLSNLAIAA
jgi:hypothetical protein